MKSPSFKAQVRGYTAAQTQISWLLDKHEKHLPKTRRAVKPKSASFRAGLYHGLLLARCLMVYGQFPQCNQQRINEILDENQEPTR